MKRTASWGRHLGHWLVWTVAGSVVLAGPNNVPARSSERGRCSVQHRYLKAGWRSQGVTVFNRDLSVEWNLPDSSEISDAWRLSDGTIVHSFSLRREKIAGIKRYGPDGKLLWMYTCDAGRDNHSCQPLPGGRFLAGEAAPGAGYAVEVGPSGKKLREVELELPQKMRQSARKDIHHVFRLVRQTASGTYLAACMRYGKAVEWDAHGKLLREFPDCHYAAVRLPDGHTLVSGRRGVREYDGDGAVCWSLEADDFRRLNLRIAMICGIQRLPNGNTVISNVSHGTLTKSGDFYRLLEFTQDKQLVWWVDDPKQMNMGSVQILDVDGVPERFGVWR